MHLWSSASSRLPSARGAWSGWRRSCGRHWAGCVSWSLPVQAARGTGRVRRRSLRTPVRATRTGTWWRWRRLCCGSCARVWAA